MNTLRNFFRQLTKKQLIVFSLLAVLSLTSIIFVYNNAYFYDRPIAKVIKVENSSPKENTDSYQNKDKLFSQNILAKVKNGPQKDKLIQLKNTYSSSHAYDQKYLEGNELFVTIDMHTTSNNMLTGGIKDVKRDKYIVLVAWIFIFVLLLVGKKQGLFSAVSIGVNTLLLTYAIDLNVRTNTNLLLICGITAVLFTVVSLLLVNGMNEKTYAAIVATLLGTISSLLITYLVMRLTSENGLYYEEMQFLTRPYRLVFIAGLIIGSLGAVMDVAVTMSSSIFELYQKDNSISLKALKTSGLDIGRDIMGTMTSILFFAYISGSIPILILYLRNASPLGFTLSMNLSLELARAMAGGIGIVLTIPIGLYTSIYFIKRKRAKI